MNFVSGLFVFFLFTLIFLYFTISARFRLLLLLVASYLFYASWSIPFIIVILVSTTTDYFLSKYIYHSASPKPRKQALVFGIVVNLLILGFFKYCNFFLESSHSLAHWLGYSLELPLAVKIILPLGISFYTFEAISYLVDVYRGKAPARSLLEYNFYIMYFPHLISGPIIRFEELWNQYKEPLQLPSVSTIAKGVELILLGYFFKVFIADSAASLSDPVFNHPATASVLGTYIGALAFTVQIYFDFMGYTHIARGASLLFNLELPINFNHPYHAGNISNFWERWHISLSRWLRDYLYFPLGGSRASLFRTCFNLFLTMTIAGFWHGAGWTFVAWGVFHGLLLMLYHLYKYVRDKVIQLPKCIYQENIAYRVVSTLLTFFCVVIGWIMFRAPNFETASTLTTRFLNIPALAVEFISALSSESIQVPVMMSLLFCCFAGPWLIGPIGIKYRILPFWLKAQLACILAILCWLVTSGKVIPFIYFQF
jgi:alginate O-acetyltransferase complex protein AlgI